MKKLLVLLFVLFLTVPSFAQSFIECPAVMEKDSVEDGSKVTRYLFFNSGNDSTKKIMNQGSIDLDIYPEMQSLVVNTDTLTVSIQGFKLKVREGEENTRGVGQVETLFGDSTYVGLVPVDSTLTTFSIENLFDSTFFPMFDGVAVGFVRGGSDLDSCYVWTNLKVYR